MKLIVAASLFVFVLAGCGSSSPKPTLYTIGPTKQCARGYGHILRPKADDFVATTASGGAFVLRFPDNDVTVLFASDANGAGGLADAYRRFHAKNVGVEDILRTQNNAVMLWKLHPTNTDEAEMTNCLK